MTEKLCKGLFNKCSALNAVISMVSFSLGMSPIDHAINVLSPHVRSSLMQRIQAVMF